MKIFINNIISNKKMKYWIAFEIIYYCFKVPVALVSVIMKYYFIYIIDYCLMDIFFNAI